MSWRAEMAQVLSRDGAAPSSLFFRQADAMRLDGCLTLLLREGQSLALSSHSEAALDHYAELLVHRLRRSAGCPVEIYFPASTAALVSRFEERVASLTLKQAMQAPADPQPERIWLVHEAGALAEGELQLLTRLVTNFPGAGVRVVLLFGASHPARQGFEGLGRRFARWDISAPTVDEAAVMRQQARQDGTLAVVSMALERLLPGPALLTTAEVLQARAGAVQPVPPDASQPPAPVSGWRRAMAALRGLFLRSSSPARGSERVSVQALDAAGPTHDKVAAAKRPGLVLTLLSFASKPLRGLASRLSRKRPSSSPGPRP